MAKAQRIAQLEDVAVARRLQKIACERHVRAALSNDRAAARVADETRIRMESLILDWESLHRSPPFSAEAAQRWSSAILHQGERLERAEQLRAETAATLRAGRIDWSTAMRREDNAHLELARARRKRDTERDEAVLQEASERYLARWRTR